MCGGYGFDRCKFDSFKSFGCGYGGYGGGYGGGGGYGCGGGKNLKYPLQCCQFDLDSSYR